MVVIGPREQEQIALAIERAKAKPIPWEELARLADGSQSSELKYREAWVKQADELYKKYPTQSLLLGTVQIAFSFETQPAGLMRHISMAVDKWGKLPHPRAIKMILEAFGFSGIPQTRPGRMWNEEYKPGFYAINVVEVEPS
jgi:hypothetical protein